MLADMRTLIGVLVFLGVALVDVLRNWPFEGPFAQDGLTFAVGFAAMLTPFIATWVMPNRLSLLVYPLAVVGLWIAAGYAGARFIPAPTGEQPYVCGLPFFALTVVAMFGVLMGVIGRAIGLAIRGEVKNAVVVYIVQVLPFGGLFALFLLPGWAR